MFFTYKILLLFLSVTIAAIIIEIAICRAFSRKLKRRLLGYEPDTFSSMFRIRENILESTYDGIIAVDSDNNVQFTNKAADKMLGCGDSEEQQKVRQIKQSVFAEKYLSDVLKTGNAEFGIQQETEKYLNGGYSSYLEYIQTQSQKQSVLQKLSRNKTQRDYIARNLEKTVQDYQALGSVTLQNGENRGILAVMHFDLTDFLLLLAPILLVMELAGDSNTAVGALIRSTKRGRVPLTAWRMLASASRNASRRRMICWRRRALRATVIWRLCAKNAPRYSSITAGSHTRPSFGSGRAKSTANEAVK